MLPIERLKILREVATKLPLENECVLIDDREFGWHQGAFVTTRRREHHICNTTACLAGWAGLDPRLQADGLITKVMPSPTGGVYSSFRLDGEDPGYSDLADFFGISYQQAGDLFDAQLPAVQDGELEYDERGRAFMVAMIDGFIKEYANGPA